jgi:hypothetical protein
MSNKGGEVPVTYRYGTGHEGAGRGTRPGGHGTMGALAGQQVFSVNRSGAAALDAIERSSCHLSLLMVVNTAMVGLVASMVFAAVEIATHVFT